MIAAAVLANSVIHRNRPQGTIHVTGLGEQNFTSDLVVWEGNFSRESQDLKAAYASLESDRTAVTNYLKAKGIPAEALVFNAVSTNPVYQQNYAPNGNYAGQTFTGYQLSQTLVIESKEVEKVEKKSVVKSPNCSTKALRFTHSLHATTTPNSNHSNWR